MKDAPEKTGSAALMTCVKETAIWEKDTHAVMCPRRWKSATGTMAMMNSLDTCKHRWR